MAKFTIGRPIITTVPEVLVDAGLPDGQHRFRLVVVDSAGNSSRHDEIVLAISRVVLPTGLGSGPIGTVRPPVLQPIVQPVPVRPPVTPPIPPVRPPRGRDRSDP